MYTVFHNTQFVTKQRRNHTTFYNNNVRGYFILELASCYWTVVRNSKGKEGHGFKSRNALP